MELLKRFKQEVNSGRLLSYSDYIVVGVSGGVDSISLAHLLIESGYNIVLAHCNFSLRGEESDEDERFVTKFALLNGVKLHTVKFDTKKEAQQRGESIQLAARRLRYEWFEALCEKERYTKIAIAHNSDDTVETFFINLTRGTGLKGLKGIPIVRDKIVRPLLFAARKDIEIYAQQKGLSYREDSSNSSDKYLRNRIRHHITPIFKELTADFNRTMIENMDNISVSYELLEFLLNEIREKSVSVGVEDGVVYVALDEVFKSPDPSYLLYEIIKDYGFDRMNCKKILLAESGVSLHTKFYRALRNRSQLVITHLDLVEQQRQEESVSCELDIGDSVVVCGVRISARLTSSINYSNERAFLDVDKLKFPLIVRRVEYGDRFRPQGMRGSKKVYDFLTDLKLSRSEKEQQLVVVSGEDIVWVVGHRIADNFKVVDETRAVVGLVMDREV